MESTLVDQHYDDDMMRAVAHLPGLDIEVTHRRAPDAEHISIHLQATPSFEAFGSFLDAANPFAFWMKTAQMLWAPWLNAARMLTLPSADKTPRTLTKA